MDAPDTAAAAWSWPAPRGGAKFRARACAFIAGNMPAAPAPLSPDIVLHTARPTSGLLRLVGRAAAPPYWAYAWAGGSALARHLAAHPAAVAGRRVLDLGCGGGIVAIAAAKARAQTVFAADIDPYALIAVALNAAANGVAVTPVEGDLTGGAPPPVDVVLVGDLFYAPDLAARVTPFLLACVEAGVEVLVGDPGRAWLPHAHLRRIAAYPTVDFADAVGSEPGMSAVYAFIPLPRGERDEASQRPL